MAMSAEKVLARRYGLSVADVTLATAMTGKQAAQFLGVSKKVGGVIAGSGTLGLKATFVAGESGYTGGFVFHWTRADKPKPRTTTVAIGATVTVTGIPVGVSCKVTSVVPTVAAPNGFAFGATTFDPTDAEIKVVESSTTTITATPTIAAA